MESVSDMAGADMRLAKRKPDRVNQISIDRLPPHAHESERGVLGCCLLSPMDCIGECIEKIKSPETFYDLRHQTIYDCLVSMYQKDPSGIDVISVQQKLKDSGMLEQVGGIAYLSELQDAVPSAANLSYWLIHVREKHILRRMISTCTKIVGDVYDYEGEVDFILDCAERDMLSIRPDDKKQDGGIKEFVSEALVKMEKLFESKGTISGLSTGLSDLDRQTDGLHGGEMIVVAAFPSMGKSALAGGIAFHNALAGNPAAIFSLEMRPAQLTVREICSQSRVNLYDIRDGKVSESDFAKISSNASRLSKSPIHIFNSNGMTINQLVAACRRIKQKHGIKLAVIDYIQLLSSPGSDSREQEVSSISKGIKSIAMELDMAVIALSQLNDDGKLRESRAIGQDADSVWQIEPEGDYEHGVQPVKLVVKKCRDGAVGSVDLLFRKTYTRFECPARIESADVPYKD